MSRRRPMRASTTVGIWWMHFLYMRIGNVYIVIVVNNNANVACSFKFVVEVYTGEWLHRYMPLKEQMVSTEADRLGQVSISNASRRQHTGSGV
ncbi:hypothetical protein Tsubulata_005352 [Turnera subulata]|uniref:Uncharacterized protein n=1 Tax=Turnera subulata TaxID=218843 RepID=A0A9Q0GDG1_9ROSI|nr:hypothetical protein Tsubulata_005352 [Turnera subulata]